jgi:hypothetical protein
MQRERTSAVERVIDADGDEPPSANVSLLAAQLRTGSTDSTRDDRQIGGESPANRQICTSSFGRLLHD